MRSSKASWILLAVCFLLYPLGASAADPLDGERFWTTTGSTGTLDEKSEGAVYFDQAKVQKGFVVEPPPGNARLRTTGKGGGDTDSAVIRYNVTAVDGLFGVKGARMAVRFLDEGVDARVTANLIEVDMLTGAQATLVTFDSDSVAPKDGYHLGEVCGDGVVFNFVEKAYYIEATLTTSALLVGSAAGIEAIQLDATPCR